MRSSLTRGLTSSCYMGSSPHMLHPKSLRTSCSTGCKRRLTRPFEACYTVLNGGVMRVKVERVSEHIWTVRAWAFIPIRVWLVRETRGVTLVDAGIPTMAKGILRTIARIEAGPLQRIILTHGHADHVGAINRIVGTDRSVGNAPVPVYAHRIEIPYIEGTVAYPGRTKAQSSVAKGLVEPLREGEDGMLQSVAGMKPYLTPGHSPGHVVYYHEQDEVLIGGDCLMSRRGQPRRPMAMFTG